MKFRQSTYVICIFGIWQSICLSFGQKEQSPLLEALIPHIQQENFELKPSGQSYMLIIKLVDDSKRIDNVELRNPNTPEEELHTTGEIVIVHPEGRSQTIYEAGKNGYLASYKYEITGFIANRISGTALKTAAG